MVALLVRPRTVNIILSRVSRLYVGQESIIALEQLIARLARENQVLLIRAAAHHDFRRRPLILLGTRILLLLSHGGLHVQTLTAVGALLIIA